MFLCSPEIACAELKATPAQLNQLTKEGLLTQLTLGNQARYYLDEVEIMAAEFGIAKSGGNAC